MLEHTGFDEWNHSDNPAQVIAWQTLVLVVCLLMFCNQLNE